jgi:hypothetical protein
MTKIEQVSKTSVFTSALTLLIAADVFTAFIVRESCKCDKVVPNGVNTARFLSAFANKFRGTSTNKSGVDVGSCGL